MHIHYGLNERQLACEIEWFFDEISIMHDLVDPRSAIFFNADSSLNHPLKPSSQNIKIAYLEVSRTIAKVVFEHRDANDKTYFWYIYPTGKQFGPRIVIGRVPGKLATIFLESVPYSAKLHNTQIHETQEMLAVSI